MRLRKITAFLLAFTMLAGMLVIPQTASADNEGYDPDIFRYVDTRADINFNVLGTTASNSLDSGFDSDFTWRKDGYIWIGVSLENLSRSASVMNGGLVDFQMALLYDGKYVQLEENASTIFNAVLNQKNPSDAITASTYEISSVFDNYPYDYDSDAALSAELADMMGGNAEYKLSNTDYEQIHEAEVTLHAKTTSNYILKNVDSDNDEHYLIVFPMKIKTDSQPPTDYKIIQNYANFTSMVGTTSSTLTYERYSESEYYLGHWFNITDSVVDYPFGTDGAPDPETLKIGASVTPSSATFDKTAGMDLLTGDSTLSFNYTNNDAGQFQALSYSTDGTNFTAFDYDSSDASQSDYTITPVPLSGEQTGSTITLTSRGMAKLGAGNYTFKFSDDGTAASLSLSDPTSDITIQAPKTTVKMALATDSKNGGTGSITSVTYDADDGSGNITQATLSPSGGQYELEIGVPYTINVTTDDYVSWSVSPTPGGTTEISNEVATDTTTHTASADFTVNSDDPNADTDGFVYTVTATFGMEDPKLTTTVVGDGSIEVYEGSNTTAETPSSGSTYTLDRTKTYTVKAIPADAHKKVSAWSDGSGDITAPTSVTNPNGDSFTFTPTNDTASTITATFVDKAQKDLTIAFDPSTATGNGVKVHEKDAATSSDVTLTNATAGTSNTMKIYELTEYTLTPDPDTASGYRWYHWDATTTDTSDYTIADTNIADVSKTAVFVTKTAAEVTPTTNSFDKNTETELKFHYLPGGNDGTNDDYPLTSIEISGGGLSTPITLSSGTGYTTAAKETPTGKTGNWVPVTIPKSAINSLASGTYTFKFKNAEGYSEPTASVKISNSLNDKIVITTPPTDMSYVHGEKLDLDGMVVTVSVDTLADEVYTYSKSLGGWYKDSATTTVVTPPFTVYYEGAVDTDSADHDSDIMRYSARTSPAAPSYKDKGLIAKVTETNHAIEGKASTVTSDKITVTQKPITYTATISDKEKVYNGTKALDTGATTSYATTDTFVTDDTVAVDKTKITSAYASPDVNWTGTAEDNVNIVSKIPTEAITGDDAGNYTISVNNVTDGKITQATINITQINNIPAARVGVARTTGSATSTAVVAETASATSTNAVTDSTIYRQDTNSDGTIDTNDTLDSITLTYGWYYSAPASTDVDDSNKNYSVALENLSLSNTNYKLGTSAAKVAVVDKEFDNYSAITAPKEAYNYSDKFDLENFAVTINYKDNAPSESYSNVSPQPSGTSAIPSDMKFAWADSGSTTWVDANELTPGTTVMKVDVHDGKDILMKYKDHVVKVGTFDISPLNIKITVTGDEHKEYDGTAAANKASLTPAVAIDGDTAYHTAYDATLTADSVSLDMTNASITAEYNSKDVNTADHLILKGLSTNALTITSGVDKSNYNITNTSNQAETTAANPKTTYITKRPLIISSISNIAAVNQFATGTALSGTAYHAVNGGDTGKATVVYTYDTTNGTYTGSQPGVIPVDTDHDKVEITFDYAYQQTTVNATGAAFNATPSDVSVSNFNLPAGTADNDNYSVSTELAAAEGRINPIVVSDVTLTLGDDSYTYIDDDDFTLLGTVVTFKEGPSGETPTTKTYTVTSIDGSNNPVWTISGTGSTTTNPPFEIYWGNATTPDTTKAVTEGQKVTPPEHDKNSTGSPRVYAVHSNGTKSPGDEVTVAKKKLTYVNATASGTITKVYNANKDLLDSSKALITYTAGYNDGTTDHDVTTDADTTAIVVTSTPTYPEIHANGANITGVTVPASSYNIDFTAPTMTTNPYYELDTGVTVTSTLTGTITKRELDVTVKDDVTVGNVTVDDGPSKKVALTRNTDYTIALKNSPVNDTETNGVATGDWSTHLTIAVEAEYTDFTKGTKTIAQANVTNTNGGDYLDDYIINFTPKAVSGEVTSYNYDYTVTTSNATVEVKDTDTTPNVVAPKTAGGTVWSLSQASGYTVTVTPAAGFVFDSWSDVTGPTGFTFTGTTATETFTMPKGNVAMTANMKLLPKWNTTPTAIDRSQNLSFKVDSDFAPDSIKIGTTTLDNTKFSATKSGSTYTIVIDKSELSGLPDADTTNPLDFEVDFTGLPTWAPAGSDKLETQVTVGNNANKTVAIENVSYTQPTGQVYGDKLNLDGFSFDKKISQTNESDIIYNYKNDNGTWKKKLSTDADSAYANVTLADDGLALVWSSTGLGTPEHDTTVLKHTVHDQDPELVVEYTPANDTTVTNVTGGQQTVSAGKLDVGQKELTVTVSDTGISKVYDATDAIDESGQTINKDKITVTVTNTVAGDTITPTVSSAKFLDKASGSKAKDVDTAKPVEVKYTLAGTNAGEYKVGTVTNIASNTFTDNTSVTGAVTVRDVTITKVTFPSKSATATDGLETGITNELFKEVVGVNLTLQTGDQVYGNDGDELQVTLAGSYPDLDLDGAANKVKTITPYTHTITDKGTVVTAANYNFIWPTDASGTVTGRTIDHIAVTKQPKYTENYTAPDNTAEHGTALDLTDLEVTIYYVDDNDPNTADTKVVPWSATATDDWTTEGLTLAWDGGNTTGATPTTNGSTLRHDTHDGAKLKVTVSGSSIAPATTDEFDITKKVITVHAVSSDITKVYDGNKELPAGVGTLTAVIDTNTAIADDVAAIVAGNIEITDVEYVNFHQNTAHNIVTKGKTALEASSFKWKSGVEAGANYDFEVNTTAAAPTGAITKRKITITKIAIDPVYVNDSGTKLTKNAPTAGLDITSASITKTGSPISGDTIKIIYRTAYTDTTVEKDPYELILTNMDYAVASTNALGASAETDYELEWPDGTENPTSKVGIGAVKGKTVDSATISSDITLYHGQELDLTGTTIHIVFADTTTDDYIYAAKAGDATTKGWYKTSDTAKTGNPLTLPGGLKLEWLSGTPTVTDGEVLRYDDATGRFIAGAGVKTGTIGLIAGTTQKDSITVSVQPRPVTLTITGGIEKTYDGTDSAVAAAGTNNTVSTAAYAFTAGNATVGGVVQTGTPLADELSVDAANTTVKFARATAHDGTVVGSEIYATVTPAYNDAAIAACYDITVVNNLTSKINKRPLTVTGQEVGGVKKIPTLTVGDPTTGTLELNNNEYTWDQTTQFEGLVSTGGTTYEQVILEYDYDFGTNGTATAGDKTITIPASDPTATPAYVNPRIKNAGTGEVGANYTLAFTPSTDGKVSNKDINDITVTPPAKTTYTHGDALDLTGLAITLNYDGGTSETFTYTGAGATATDDWTWDKALPTSIKSIDWANADAAAPLSKNDEAVQRYDSDKLSTGHTRTINIVYQNEGASEVTKPVTTITVEQKKISTIAIAAAASVDKPYDAKSDAAATGVTLTPAGVVSGDTVKVNADLFYAESGTTTKAVNANADTTYALLAGTTDPYDIQGENAVLPAKSADDNNDCYILDPTGVTFTTTVTGKIRQLEIDVTKYPVTAAVKDASAASPLTVHMTVQEIGATDDRIQIGTTHDGNIMPAADKTAFKAEYYVTYPVAVLTETDTDLSHVFFSTAAGVATTDKPTVTGITTSNYIFNWPAPVGSLVDNAISGLDTNYAATFYHGDPLNFGADKDGPKQLQFTVTYLRADSSTYDAIFRSKTDGSWEKSTDNGTTYTAVASLVAEGIELEWTNTTEANITAAHNDILRRNMHPIVGNNGVDTITIKARSTATTAANYSNGYITKQTNNITILPLPLYASVEAGDLEKVYDGTKALEATDLANVKFDTFYYDKTASFAGPTATPPSTYGNTLGDDISIDKTGVEYDDENVNWSGTVNAPVIGNVDVNLPAAATALTGANKANYDFKGFIYNDGTNYKFVTTLDGKITQKPLDIEITGVPSIKASLPDAQRVDTKLTSDYYTITGKVGSDDVDAEIWYKYPAGNTNLNPTIDLKGADKTTAVASHSQADLTGAKATNYDPTFHPASVTGTIEKATINTLTVSGPTKTDYVHGDQADLIGLRVQADTTDPSVKYDFEFAADTYGDNPGWRQKKAVYDDTAGDQSYPTLSAAVQAAGLADVITLNLVNATGGTAGAAVSGGLDNQGVLRHNVHNNTAFYGTTGSLSSLSTDTITVDTKKVYASTAVKNGQYIEKLYDATAVIGSDTVPVANKTKLDYTLLEKVDNTGTFTTDYRTLVTLTGETVTADDSGVTAKFVDNAGNDRSDVHGAWSPVLSSFGLFAVNRSRAEILPWDVKVEGLDIDDQNTGNYEFVEIVGNKPEGKIYPADVTVTATSVDSVYADDEGETLVVPVKAWTATGYKNASDENDITFTWNAKYDLTEDPATVTVDTDPSIITVSATAGATNPNAFHNYDFTFAGNPAPDVKAVQVSRIVINTQPDFATQTPTAEHGTQIADAGGWDNLDFTIEYNSGKKTRHKRTETGWQITDIGDDGTAYSEPPADLTYTWSNTNTAVNPDDIDDLRVLRPTDTQTNTNQITIAAPTGDSATTTPVTPEKKKVKVNVEGKYEKDYDGTPDVNLDDTNPEVTFTIDPDDIVPGDIVTLTPPSLTFTTSDVSDDNPIIIGNDAVLSNDNYEIEIIDGEQAFVTDEDFENSAIKAKKIKVTITVPTIKSGGAADVTGTISYNTTADTENGSFTTTNADDIAAKDKANIQLTYSGKRDVVTNTGSANIETTVTLDPAIPTISGTGINPANYVIETATATGQIEPAKKGGGGTSSSGGGGGGSANSLTIHYENEDGTAGEEVSKIEVPLGTDPTDLIGVIKTKIKDMTVLWSSDNEEVATVDENGIVTYVGEGTATITAVSKQTKSLKDTVEVIVTAEPETTPAPTEKPDDGGSKRTHERVRDSLITKTMLNPYIVGYDDYVFGPELPISREELAAIFARLIANNLYMDQDYDTSFPDVPEKWSKSYIGYLEGFEVVTGYEDGNFRPENNITRAEMAVMMAKAEGYDITPDISAEEAGFPDVDEGYASWSAAKAIQILSDLGIMSGYEDGTFRPGQPITRAETVATVNRVLAAQEVADREVLPSDVTSAHWAYEDIVFAMNHRILKDASADPNAFIWSEEFDKNMVTTTEKVNGETEVVEGEEPSEETSSDGTASEKSGTETDTETKEDADTPKSADKPTI